MNLSNRGYDNLKFIALVLLPGLAAAYFGLAQLWHLPNAEQVVGTATVLDTFLGLVLKSSSSKYVDPQKNDDAPADGQLVIVQDDEAQYLGVAWDERFQGLTGKDTVKLHVVLKEPQTGDGTK